MVNLQVDDGADVHRIVRPRRKRRTGRRLLMAALALLAALGAIVLLVLIVQTFRGADENRVEVALRPDGTVSLSGAVPERSDRDRVFDIMVGRYGADRVDDDIRVDDDLLGEPGIVVIRGRVARDSDQRQLEVIGREIATPRGWIVENNAIVVPEPTAAAVPDPAASAVVPTTARPAPTTVTTAVATSTTSEAIPSTTAAPSTTQVPTTTTTAAPTTTTTVDVATLEAELNAGIGSADVIFGYNSADLTNEAKQQLNSIAGILAANPGPRVEVGGHTDATGPAGRNQTLSQQRADAVVGHLIDQGIDRGRLVGTGYGETENIATNRTDDGRAQNRRIEFKILS